MKRLFIVLGSIAGIAFVLLLAAAAWIFTFDPNENKDWIAEKFQASTGRTLTLGGDVGLTIYPWLGVTANDVIIGNTPGFSANPLLLAEQVQFRIKLMPLLSDSYEIDTVQLYGARINLEVLGNGQANWATPDSADAVAEEPADSASALPANLVIGGVDIREFSLVYDDQLANTHYEISNLNASIGELVYGAPLDITLSLDATSRAPQLATSANLTGTVLYDLDNGRYDIDPFVLAATLRGPNVPNGSADLTLSTALAVDLDNDTLTLANLDFAALGARLTANVEATAITSDTPAVNATLNVAGSDLAVLFRILEQNELAQRVASLNSNYSISASVDADLRTGTLSVPALEAALLGADISGTLNGTRINSATPVLNGRLTAAGPDLPTLVEVIGMLQGGSSGALTGIGRDLARVPDKAFRVESAFDVDLQSGDLEVPELYAGLFGATVTGNVSGTRINSDTPQLNGQLNAQGPDLPLLLQIAGQLGGGVDSALNQYGDQLRRGVSNRAFTLATSFDADLQRGDIQLPELNAALLGFRLSGSLDARNMEANNGSITGALQLQGENLREVLAAIGQGGLGEVAQSVTLDIGVNGTRNDLRISPLNAALVVAGGQIGNTPQTLSLDAATQMNLGNDSLRVDAFTLSGLGLNLRGSVSATRLSTDTAFTGQLELPAFNARRLLEQLNMEVPVTADNTVLQNVAFATGFTGTANSLELADLAVTLDDSRLAGSLAISDFTTQATRFNLNIDSIDADRYMAPTTETASAAAAEPGQLPVEQIKALNVQGAINIAALTVSGLNMSDIVLEVNAAGGDLALNPFRANLYGGSFDGDIRLNVNGAEPAATVATTLNAINLGPLLQDFMDATYLTGTGNIQLALAGNGTDSAAIKRNLNGSGSINLQDGVLTGVDVQAVLRSIETMIRSRQLANIPQGGQTPFESFAATLAVDNGVVASNDLLIKAPGWQVNGAGTLANLANDSIDFNLVTSVDRSTASDTQQYNLGGYTLPIACTGSLQSPRCLPDAQQIIAASVTNAVQQRLGEFLQDRLGTGQQQQAPATDPAPATGDTAPPAESAPQQPPPTDPGQELLNRALDRLLR